MDRAELLHELDRIIDVGIVNAKHDSDVLRHIRKELKKNDFQTFLEIFNHRSGMISHYEVLEDDGKYSIVLRDFDQSVVLVFDEKGMLIG